MLRTALILSTILPLLVSLAGCLVNPVVPVTPASPVGQYYVYTPYYYDYPYTYYLSPPVFGYFPYGSFGPMYGYGRQWGPLYGH